MGYFLLQNEVILVIVMDILLNRDLHSPEDMQLEEMMSAQGSHQNLFILRNFSVYT